ncbi:MAG TPA: hypothetical protein DEP46_11415 [Blastocatellia bacterium]|nr:hypothetical protein [Blastocatellia bacterium]
MSERAIKIELSLNEALVLSEFVDRYTNTNQLTIEDQAEQRVLWNICCELEKVLIEPFMKGYPEMLEKARAEVRDSLD